MFSLRFLFLARSNYMPDIAGAGILSENHGFTDYCDRLHFPLANEQKEKPSQNERACYQNEKYLSATVMIYLRYI